MAFRRWRLAARLRRGAEADRAEFRATLISPMYGYSEVDFLGWRRRRYSMCWCGHDQLRHGPAFGDASAMKCFYLLDARRVCPCEHFVERPPDPGAHSGGY